MLRKLLKYDFRALNRFLVIIHIILLALALLGRIALQASVISLGEIGIAGTFGIFLIIVYVVMILAAIFVTQILVAVWFYRNLYSDEGYLTHTLPVSEGELLTSKVIAGSAWLFVDQLLVAASLGILLLFRPMVDLAVQNKSMILQVLDLPEGLSLGAAALWILVLSLAASLQGVALMYLAVAVGQLFENHRVWAAVVAYGILNSVRNALGSAAGFGTGVLSSADNSLVQLLFGGNAGGLAAAAVSILLSLLIAAVGFGVTWHLMRTKLNLS